VATKGVRSRSAPLVIAMSCLFFGAGALVLAPGVPVEVASARAGQSYNARGVIQSIAKDRSSLLIAHEAIPGFMPAMTMAFDARSPEQLAGLHEKERVNFSFTVTDDGRRLIDSIHSTTKSP
jgi:Cu/Ag efflux protein CusF